MTDEINNRPYFGEMTMTKDERILMKDSEIEQLKERLHREEQQWISQQRRCDVVTAKHEADNEQLRKDKAELLILIDMLRNQIIENSEKE